MVQINDNIQFSNKNILMYKARPLVEPYFWNG